MRSASAEQSAYYQDDHSGASGARSKLPFEVSDHLAQHLTLVSDPKDIVTEVDFDRKCKFHLLIQRYISQIQYGCKNPSCTTPTCLSCRKRLASLPVRKYTALSARTLACFLADTRQPEAALCRNEPVHPVEPHKTGSYQQAENATLRRKSTAKPTANGHVAPEPSYGRRSNMVRQSSNQRASLGSHAGQGPHSPTIDKSTPDPPPRKSAKDPTSFTQALFDTLPLRLLEWMPRRSQGSPPPKTCSDRKHSSYDVVAPPKTNVGQKAFVSGEGTKKMTACGTVGEDHHPTNVPRPNGFLSANGHAKEPARLKERRRSSISTKVHKEKDESGLFSLPTSKDQAERLQSRQSGGSQTSDMLEGQGCNHQQSSTTKCDDEGCLSVPTLTCLSTDILKDLQDLHKKQRCGLLNSSSLDFFRQSIYYCLKDPHRLSASFETPDSRSADSDVPSISGQNGSLLRLNVGSVGLNLRSMAILCSWDEIFRNLSIAIHELGVPARSLHLSHPDHSSSDLQAARVCVVGLYALSQLVQDTAIHGILALPELFDYVRAKGRSHSFRDEVVKIDPEIMSFLRHYVRRTDHAAQSTSAAQNNQILELCDVFDDFMPLSLLETILGVVANRWTYGEISKTRKNVDYAKLHGRKGSNIMQLILEYMADDVKQRSSLMAVLKESILSHRASQSLGSNHGQRHASCPVSQIWLGPDLLSRVTLCWLRTIMLRDWDGKSCVKKSGTVGIVLQILAAMYEKRCSIGIEPEEFWTPIFVQRLDPFDMPMEWLDFRPDNRTVHLLSYSFLFPPQTVVNYFRTINYSRMMKSMEEARLKSRAYREFIVRAEIPVARGREWLEERLEIPGGLRFVVEVRRDNVLTDAINQIWRRPRPDLLRPLKVRMGMDEGEEGVDVGGVQQEMFRVLFGQALDPSYGMFTIDEETRMTWFQPESLEPLYKFEALGVLMSLAVYNSITLPITFPVAFYRKLLGLKVKKLDHIRDGWPQLAENLQSMLDWKDGDVAEVYMRTYEFTYEAFGRVVSIDISRHGRDVPWPPGPSQKGKEKAKTTSFDMPPEEPDGDSATPAMSPSMSQPAYPISTDGHQDEPPEAPLVTNSNREQYVKDYIFWLTDKSIRPQFEAFARGFYTCLDRTALSIFTAEALQAFVEGVQDIDMDGLEASTVYQEYTADDQVVRWFWDVVKSWDLRRQKLLLEFVTASDRVPVNGVKAIGFGIQREGKVDERLPSSHTCFGTLLLPQYSSREVLERMLGVAVEQAKGFGTF